MYSLANAAVCLGIERSTLESAWSAAVTALAHPADFLDPTMGTGRNVDDPHADVVLARAFLDALSPGQFAVTLLDRTGDLLSSVRAHLNVNSVLLIDNTAHWYCIVDVEQHALHAACSAALTNDTPCEEWTTSTELNLRRRANAKVTGIARLEQVYLRMLKVERSG
ncbi:MAG: hypothetical protein ACLGI6_11005 [Gammaproteobacteria bacterium]